MDFQELLGDVIKTGKQFGWKTLELRGHEHYSQELVFSSCFLHHSLKLSIDEYQVFQNFRSNVRRNIRKAVREGVKVHIYQSVESLHQYYRVHCQTRRRHGLPPQPFSFFKKIQDHVISKELGFTILAKYQEKVIAGAVFFHFGNHAVYKYGASDLKYQYLRANNLVMWEAIKWFSQNVL